MPDLTEMEMAAIKAARLPLYNALVVIGISDVFNSCTPQQIDSVIAAVWGGLRASMSQQSATEEVPF